MASGASVVVVEVTNGSVLGDRVEVARTALGRLRGLLGRRGLAPGSGLLLQPCNGVHTFGMQFSIDVLFLDADGLVLRSEDSLPPGHVVPWVRRAKQALELPAGTAVAAGIAAGTRLRIEANP